MMPTFVRRILGRGLFNVFFLIPLVVLVEIPIFCAGAGVAAYLVYSNDLPRIPHLASYLPRTVSTFYADDGTVIGVFYHQKRFVVDLEQIPPHVVEAFLAAEDSRFYEHSGVDWQGFARAAIANVKSGRIVQGGSTITMQVARNLFLTRERRLSRKIKEILLAYELERLWGKKKILYIYLNEIYLGEGCYGVEAAARGYFDKPIEQLNVPEGALIAGLVSGPSRNNPFKNGRLARGRQLYVLGRMVANGFITNAEYQQAKYEQVAIKKDNTKPFDLVPDFAEEVRRYIVRKYGADRLYNEGLKVFTTCRVDYQRMAHEALEKGLKEIRARQKNLAILRTLPANEISERLKRRSSPELKEGKVYQGVIVKIAQMKKQTELHVALSKSVRGRVHIPKAEAAPYKVGQVLALRFDKFADESAFFTLDDDPNLEGALVCIENRTGYVRALVGGASREHFKFNRATQGKRQPGSAFKPIIYAAAVEKRSYSPATVIVDEPIVVDLENAAEEEWEPKNAGGNFLGPISFRSALELSRNICTIKVLMDTKFDPVIEMARKMGISAPLGRNLSLSLGTSELSLYEITSAYTVFPNSGVYVEPILVKRIEDRFGNVLEDNTDLPVLNASEIPHPAPRDEFKEIVQQDLQEEDVDDDGEIGIERSAHDANPLDRGRGLADEKRSPRIVRPAMSPQSAYVMTSMLQGVVRRGTGAGLRRILDRKDLAGKTGTTNNAEDTWFIGFSPEFTTGVWVGFDEKRPLGRREGGGRAALPIWGYFAKDVLKGVPVKEFPVPPDISFEEMTTYVGNPKDGFFPGTVTEPVYSRTAGFTLVMSPLDSPESLRDYRPAVPDYDPQAQAYLPPGRVQYGPGNPIYSTPPQQVVPVHPMVGGGYHRGQATPHTGPPGYGPTQAPVTRWDQPPGAFQGQPPGQQPPAPMQDSQPYEEEDHEDDGEPSEDAELPQLPDFDSQPGVAPYFPGNR
ncbi:MAG: PBP1A family penicillin-binding protein [Desulfomonilaceae bacterium]|nr:PBP1A family penicillin-binding protein [Desulfomonilaceae bacterium]